ncbi:MAG TPA: type II toxin-antitoxin system RelE/ParE family toxin [Gammaproteobacteria bacterium]|nr:type II toxin-antitoxin system RelE/ParE family toxin [Gammaproteobacteria bacterium]
MQTYSIIIVEEAENDLHDIWLYIAVNDLPAKADDLRVVLKKKCYSLSYIPERGRRVRELEELNIFDFYEIFYKPYRIIYKLVNTTVFIYGIFDGRRELKELLSERVRKSYSTSL